MIQNQLITLNLTKSNNKIKKVWILNNTYIEVVSLSY